MAAAANQLSQLKKMSTVVADTGALTFALLRSSCFAELHNKVGEQPGLHCSLVYTHFFNIFSSLVLMNLRTIIDLYCVHCLHNNKLLHDG
jgi:hypothetical protein